MLAQDLADLFLSRRADESRADACRAVERAAQELDWRCAVREVDWPRVLPDPGAGEFLALAIEPLPPARILEHVVGRMLGEARLVRLAYFDPRLCAWRLAGAEWGFAQAGLTLHDAFDAHVGMSGSLFALWPDARLPSTLFFGPPTLFAATILEQTLANRGSVTLCERVELLEYEPAPDPRGPALRGALEFERAPLGAIVCLVEDRERGAPRLVPGAFASLEEARAAYRASREPYGQRVLLARIAARVDLD